MPAPIASVSPSFHATLNALIASSLAVGDGLAGTGTREWQAPPTGAWSGDPYDIPGLSQAFDRSDLNADFEKIISDSKNPGTAGDAIATKAQVDYLACMERAYRAKSASPVRLLIVSGARRRGHGSPVGVFGRVLTTIEASISAGVDSGGAE